MSKNADYSKPITVTLGSGAPKECIITVIRDSHATCSFSINDSPVATGSMTSGVHYGFEYGEFHLKAGDVPKGSHVAIIGAFEILQ
jgi:hypothetical protein